MVSRSGRSSLVGLVLLALTATACERVPLFAPTGSTITLTTATSALAVNGTAQIIAQVLESAGTPPHSGTEVTFTTTLGHVDPAVAQTDASGRVTVQFSAGTSSGNATIAAASGGASTGTAGVIKIAVGTAAVGSVRVGASPASVPGIGGSTTITASVLDINGNALPLAPVSFTTTAGSLGASVVTTDTNGIAQTVLTTSQQAVVTVAVGAQAVATTTPTTPSTSGTASATVTVTVNATPALVITAPTTSPNVGVPASFTFAVTAATTNGSTVRDLRVMWGDGGSTDLGAVTGSATASHTYQAAGSYTVSGTLTDSSGNVVTVSNVISVISVPAQTVSITPPSTLSAGLPASFTFTVSGGTNGSTVRDLSVNWGDTGPLSMSDLGSVTGSASASHTYGPTATTGSYTVTATVTDSFGNVFSVSTVVNVIPVAVPTVIVTPSIPSSCTGAMGSTCQVTFQLQVTPPTGVGIVDAQINYGDGTFNEIGGLSGTATASHTYPAGAGGQTVILRVQDTLGRFTQGTATINIP